MRDDWFEFINARMETEREQYSRTEEYRHRRVIEAQQEEMLETNLTRDDKRMVDEVMFARCLSLERDGERLYRQGMRDCVEILKMLGILS